MYSIRDFFLKLCIIPLLYGIMFHVAGHSSDCKRSDASPLSTMNSKTDKSQREPQLLTVASHQQKKMAPPSSWKLYDYLKLYLGKGIVKKRLSTE